MAAPPASLFHSGHAQCCITQQENLLNTVHHFCQSGLSNVHLVDFIETLDYITMAFTLPVAMHFLIAMDEAIF